MARTLYLNESLSNLLSASCSFVSHSEEGNNRLCLDIFHFTYISITLDILESKNLPLPQKKVDSAKIHFIFLYDK